MSKNIVFCADGTWSGLGQGDGDDRVQAAATNVLRLFAALDGRITEDSMRKRDEQEKTVTGEAGEPVQVAKYLHGVGDSSNAIRKILGGVFGEGFIERIVRGYTYVSRNYAAGDRIFLAGFSRGAYTVRALAGMITKMGLLPAKAMQDERGQHDPERAYRLGIHVWARYREQAGKHSTLLGYLSEFKGESIALDQLVRDVPIDTVAVWDTVGSLGIPVHGGKDANRVDIFQFADLMLSPRVGAGFHALAIDEQRADFAPTLWEPREGVVQRWFCGAHSDVGGGGAPGSFFSVNSLRWMIAKLASRGVLFAQAQLQPALPAGFCAVHASHLDPPFDLLPHALRQFPPDALFHPSVQVFLSNFPAYSTEALEAWLQGGGRQLEADRLSE
ncbi:DUF2235 domain-containing protein [Variovorax sp. OV329]|uniref:DUF2235 domain-containing protein n=1 Tax=Variovorax sp. OV329 TaxID=1882825 RepID=UPI0008E0382B|nr:DUF2235 domain-containing protein [Variovorax sp. OV329]SFM63995.1 Uncharacterized alpha/beta hydrolase domain [Variovorax sp. OV329]